MVFISNFFSTSYPDDDIPPKAVIAMLEALSDSEQFQRPYSTPQPPRARRSASDSNDFDIGVNSVRPRVMSRQPQPIRKPTSKLLQLWLRRGHNARRFLSTCAPVEEE